MPLTQYMADPVEEKLLHMVTGDPRRTPTTVLFGNDDFWIGGGATSCGGSCVSENPTEAWNHGDVQPQITTTFLGMVGPGVSQLGVDNATWSDHTDIRPTMLALLGLHDDYTSDGRVLLEDIQTRLPSAERNRLLQLGRLYSQLNAAVGEFGIATLKASTAALASDTPGDAEYTAIENTLRRLGIERDQLVSAIRVALDGGGFGTDSRDLTGQATRLLAQAQHLG